MLRALTVGCGAAYAATAAFHESMNADGMNYLDMGDAYLRGDWEVAVNAVWSPLYSWLLGTTLAIVKPSIRWEFPLVHLVNLAIYVVAMLCFEFFWRQVTAAYRDGGRGTHGETAAVFPPRIWLSIGYALFVWSSLTLIEVWAVTPDMLVAACVYLAAGLLVRIRTGRATPRTFVVLGVVLGVGYLAKAVLFPMAFVVLGLAVLVQSDLRRAIPRVLPAVALFVVVAGPYLAAVSAKEGRLTYGSVGKLIYLKHVSGIPYPHWISGIVNDVGEPDHPARRLVEDPRVYEFATPIGGTYPLSYDPAYWYEGLEPRFHLRSQLVALALNGEFYFDLFVRRQGGLLAVTLLLGAMALGPGRRLRRYPGGWELVLFGLAGLGLYSLVCVTGRYVAAFVVLVWAGVWSHVRLSDAPVQRRLLAIGGVTMTVFLTLDLGAQAWYEARGLLGVPDGIEVDSTQVASSPAAVAGDEASRPLATRPSRVAEGLLAVGLRPGDHVGFVGYSFDAYWARLARLKIVAELVPADADRLWHADSQRRSAVMQAFRSAGAVAVVSEYTPQGAGRAGWRRVGDTSYWVYSLVDRAEER